MCSCVLVFCFWGITEVSQQLIVDQGGISLLSLTAADAEDPQTLRMVAGAIANLCGNGKITSSTSFSFEQETDQFLKCFFCLADKLQARLWSDGGIKALLGMVRCGHPDVLAQVARGIANFAKCESRATTQGKELFQFCFKVVKRLETLLFFLVG